VWYFVRPIWAQCFPNIESVLPVLILHLAFLIVPSAFRGGPLLSPQLIRAVFAQTAFDTDGPLLSAGVGEGVKEVKVAKGRGREKRKESSTGEREGGYDPVEKDPKVNIPRHPQRLNLGLN